MPTMTAPQNSADVSTMPTCRPDHWDKLPYRWARARLNPHSFQRYFVRTLDQHDKSDPVKAFPWRRAHLQAITDLWADNPLLIICKSRQMMMTWLFCVLALWDAMFHPGRLIMLQSKREEDAVGDEVAGDGLLGRCKFILNHLPGAVELNPQDILLPDGGTAHKRGNRIQFSRNSTLWAIPQGASIIRQRTASGILSDEAAFQDEFSDAYTAALPCIRGGGWFAAVSTPHPSFFQHLYQDTLGDFE